jgi:hypothetical protein
MDGTVPAMIRVVVVLAALAGLVAACDRIVDLTPGVDAPVSDTSGPVPDAGADGSFPFPDAAPSDAAPSD